MSLSKIAVFERQQLGTSTRTSLSFLILQGRLIGLFLLNGFKYFPLNSQSVMLQSHSITSAWVVVWKNLDALLIPKVAKLQGLFTV